MIANESAGSWSAVCFMPVVYHYLIPNLKWRQQGDGMGLKIFAGNLVIPN